MEKVAKKYLFSLGIDEKNVIIHKAWVDEGDLIFSATLVDEGDRKTFRISVWEYLSKVEQ